MIDTRRPHNFTEAKADVACPQKRNPVPVHRLVYLDRHCMSRARNRKGTTVLDIYGPPPGKGSLTVVILGGMIDLHVHSGTVNVTLSSVWGNVLTVHPAAAETTVATMGEGAKAHVYGLPAESITGDTARLRRFDSAADNPRAITPPAATDVPF